MEIRRSGPNRRSALEALRITLVFQTPVSMTVCPYPLIDLLTFSTTPNAIDASCANRARSLVDPTFRHQSPGDPRYAVRQRHRDDKAGLFLQHAFEPGLSRRARSRRCFSSSPICPEREAIWAKSIWHRAMTGGGKPLSGTSRASTSRAT